MINSGACNGFCICEDFIVAKVGNSLCNFVPFYFALNNMAFDFYNSERDRKKAVENKSTILIGFTSAMAAVILRISKDVLSDDYMRSGLFFMLVFLVIVLVIIMLYLSTAVMVYD